MSAKLDVVPVAIGAFTKTLENVGLIFQVGLVPFGGLFVLLTLLSFFGSGSFITIIGQIGAGVATAMLVAPLYRFYLLNETPPDDMFAVNFGDRETNLTIIFVAYALISLIPTWMASLSSILGFVLSLAMIFVIIRLILLPPLTALDNPIDPAAAFSKTEGNFWRLVLGGILVAIPIVIVMIVFGAIGLLGSMVDGGLATGPISAFVLAVFQLVGTAISAAFTSGVYQALVSDEAPPAIAANPAD